ncbi:octanoyl-[acyl-carrier-protein]:protein N-octanoyltransferase LIPT2, mitochondrial isoform X1 [Stigmatopora argus]
MRPATVEVVRLGLLPYGQALRLQRTYAERCRAGGGASHALLLCQHPPVYTTGFRQKGRPPPGLERLRDLGAEVHAADRGGLITFHGPGQLVCYPVLHLASFKKSIRWYVSQLERTVVAACAGLGVEASASPHTGVWVGDHKICAIGRKTRACREADRHWTGAGRTASPFPFSGSPGSGPGLWPLLSGVRCSGYVTWHGLALNCNTELTWFDHIVPCGLEGKGVTSLSAELRRDVGVDEATPHLLHAFARHFDCRLTGDN